MSARAPQTCPPPEPAAEAAGGNKKRRRRRTTTIVDSDCTTCSSCQSRLIHVSEVTRAGSLDLIRCSGTLSCAACGSALTPLRDLVR